MNNNDKFVSDVEAWAAKAARQMEDVAKKSLSEVVEKAQKPVTSGGNMPVRSGDLRDSLVTKAGAGTIKGANSYDIGLAAWKIGDPFTVGWSANYALSRHYMVGAKGGGGLWRDAAAQSWPGIVRKNALAAK